MADRKAGIWIVQRTIPHYRAELFRRLHSSHNVRVLTASNPPGGQFIRYATDELAPAVCMPFEFDRTDPFQVKVPVKAFLDRYDPGIVIAEFGLRYSSTYDLVLARRMGRLRRLCFWSHGWQMERGFRRISDLAVQAARIPLFYQADAVATYGREGADWVRRWCPGEPVFSLGNSLDDAAIARAAASSHPARAGTPSLLAIGRLKADKGLDLLLDAFRGVRGHLPQASLTIIGDGPEESPLRDMARRLGLEGVSFAGPLHDEAELAPHFLGADFLVVPGAAGLSVNHALAYRLPVIAFARSAEGPLHHPEIEYVEPGVSGILAPGRSAVTLAQTIVDAHRSGASARLKASLAIWADAPSLDKMTAAFGRLIEHLRG